MSDHRFYYTTADRVVVNAMQEYFDKRHAVERAGKRFARMFGGTAVFGGWKLSLVGVIFQKPPKDEHLWTKRTRSSSWLRPKVSGGGPEGKKLRDKWKANWPHWVADEQEWLGTLDLIASPFTPRGYFLHAGRAYVMSRNLLASDKLKEILGSEYVAVEKEVLK